MKKLVSNFPTEESNLITVQPGPMSSHRATMLSSALVANETLARLTGELVSKTGLTLQSTLITLLQKIIQLALNVKNQTLDLPLDHRTELYHQLTTHQRVQSCTSQWLEPFLCGSQASHYLHARRAGMPFQATSMHYLHAAFDTALTGMCIKGCAEEAAMLPTAWTLHELGATAPLKELLKELTWKGLQQTPALDALVKRSLGQLLDQQGLSYRVLQPWIKEVFRFVIQSNIQTVQKSNGKLVAYHHDGAQTHYQILSDGVVNTQTFKDGHLTQETFNIKDETVDATRPAKTVLPKLTELAVIVVKARIKETFKEEYSTAECRKIIKEFSPAQNSNFGDYLRGVMNALVWKYEDHQFKTQLMAAVTQPAIHITGMILRDDDGKEYSPSNKMDELFRSIIKFYRDIKLNGNSPEKIGILTHSFRKEFGFTLDTQSLDEIAEGRASLSEIRNRQYTDESTQPDDGIIDTDFRMLCERTIIPHFMTLAGKLEPDTNAMPEVLKRLLPTIQEKFLKIHNKADTVTVNLDQRTIDNLHQSPIRVPKHTPQPDRDLDSPANTGTHHLHYYRSTTFIATRHNTPDSPVQKCNAVITALRAEILAFNTSLAKLSEKIDSPLPTLDLDAIKALEDEYNTKATGPDIPLKIMMLEDIGSIAKTKSEYARRVKVILTQIPQLKRQEILRLEKKLPYPASLKIIAARLHIVCKKETTDHPPIVHPQLKTATPAPLEKVIPEQPKRLSADTPKQVTRLLSELHNLCDTLDPQNHDEEKVLSDLQQYLNDQKIRLLSLKTEGDYLEFQLDLRSSPIWINILRILYSQTTDRKIHTALFGECDALNSGKPTLDTSLFQRLIDFITHIQIARQITGDRSLEIPAPQLPNTVTKKITKVKLPADICDLTAELHQDLQELSDQHRRLVDIFKREQEMLARLSKQSPINWDLCQKAMSAIEACHASLQDLSDGILHSDLDNRRQTLQEATDDYVDQAKTAHQAQAQETLHQKRYLAQLKSTIQQFNSGDSDLTLEEATGLLQDLQTNERIDGDTKRDLLDQLNQIHKQLYRYQERGLAQNTLHRLSYQLSETDESTEGQLGTRFLLGQIVSLFSKPQLLWGQSMDPTITEQFVYWRDALLKDPHHVPAATLSKIKELVMNLTHITPWDEKFDEHMNVLRTYTHQYLRISQNPRSIYWVRARLAPDEQTLKPVRRRDISTLTETAQDHATLAMLVILKDVTASTPATHQLRNRLAHQANVSELELKACLQDTDKHGHTK